MSDYIYETNKVSKGRTSKYCSSCGKTIPKGASSITVTVYRSEFMAENVCNEICLKQYEIDFAKDTGEYEDGERDDEFE